MKKIIIFSIATILFASCANLEEIPESQLSTSQFYKTQSDAISAVTAVYSALNHTDSNLPYYNALFNVTSGFSADDNQPGPKAGSTDARSLAAFTATSTNSNYLAPWVQSYRLINRANTAIDLIPSISGDTTVLNRLVREAKFLRGLAYYNLVRWYGGVPLVLHETTSLANLQIARSTVDEVYAQIIKDFTDATYLPATYTSSDVFRATSGAAYSLLMSVAITHQQWQEASNYYSFISKLGYQLYSNFGDNFSSSVKYTGGSNLGEHIFDAWQISDGNTASPTGDTNIMGQREAPANGMFVGGGTGGDTDNPNVTLRQYFKSYDKRTAVTFIDSVLVSSTSSKKTYNPHFYKWYDPNYPKNLLNDGVNVPIIRYAEVVLYYAEAQNELNGPNSAAYTAINKIRNRAGLPNLTTGLTQDQFRDSVFLERRKEFAHEAVVRWFDLVRTNGSGTQLLFTAIANLIDPSKGGNPTDSWCVSKATNIRPKHLLFPIPYTEIQVNPLLTQNPGWE
jgi:hypothetical protein